MDCKDTILNCVHVQAVEKALDNGIAPLVDKYTNSVLQDLKKDIHDTVQKAITDSIPQSWPQSQQQDSVNPFSRTAPLRNCNQVFQLKPDMEGPLMRLCDNYLQNDTSFWVKGVQELFPKDVAKPPEEWSSSEATKFCQNPPLRLAERFGGEQGVVAQLTDTVKQKQVGKQIREAVSGFARRFSSEIASAEAWPKTLTPNGVVVEVVKADRVDALTNNIALSFLRFNTEMLEDMYQRVDILVEQANLIENCASERHGIMEKIAQIERAQDGIIELLCEHTKERQELEIIGLVRRVGTCVVVTETYRHIPRGTVCRVKSLESNGYPVMDFTVNGQSQSFQPNDFGIFRHLYVLTAGEEQVTYLGSIWVAGWAVYVMCDMTHSDVGHDSLTHKVPGVGYTCNV